MNIKGKYIAGRKSPNKRLHLVKLENDTYMLKIKRYDASLRDMKIYSEDIAMRAVCERGVQEVSLVLSEPAMRGLAQLLNDAGFKGDYETTNK